MLNEYECDKPIEKPKNTRKSVSTKIELSDEERQEEKIIKTKRECSEKQKEALAKARLRVFENANQWKQETTNWKWNEKTRHRGKSNEKGNWIEKKKEIKQNWGKYQMII